MSVYGSIDKNLPNSTPASSFERSLVQNGKEICMITHMNIMYVVLDNVRSAHNVGAIFRTADGAGVAKIFLVGVTPQPIDRFGRVMPEIAKTSLGATETVQWEYCVDAAQCIEKLCAVATEIIVVEQDARSVSYEAHHAAKDVAFVFGNEIDGVSSAFKDAADAIVDIPMHGTKESLNVATTAGIILFNHCRSEQCHLVG